MDLLTTLFGALRRCLPPWHAQPMASTPDDDPADLGTAWGLELSLPTDDRPPH